MLVFGSTGRAPTYNRDSFLQYSALWIHSGLSTCLFILSSTGSLPVTEITECLFTETPSNYTNTETVPSNGRPN